MKPIINENVHTNLLLTYCNNNNNNNNTHGTYSSHHERGVVKSDYICMTHTSFISLSIVKVTPHLAVGPTVQFTLTNNIMILPHDDIAS